jgi:hypothetical protein
MTKSPEEKREYHRQWKKKNIEKVRASRRLWNLRHREDIIRWAKEHPEKVAEAKRRIRDKHPERVAVYSRVQRRIKNNKISKPKVCSSCKKTGIPIEGHHLDYNKPYELTWLCRICHKILHRKNEGKE